MDQVNDYPMNPNWIGEYDNDPQCVYNAHVCCKHHRCEVCGWNPFVSLERIVAKYGNTAADYLTLPGG